MKLMPNREKIDESHSPSPEEAEGTTTAYIILCDGCDAEFYSEEAYKVSSVFTYFDGQKMKTEMSLVHTK